jgi:hypothetical protein
VLVLSLQRAVGLDLAEEGFQWLGSVRTTHGGIPFRDFYSYDPGRYVWTSLWARWLGDGILALRTSTAIFGAIGLAFGLAAVRRATPNPGVTVFAGVILISWMFPRHKIFEPATAMIAVFACAQVLEEPSPLRHLGLGIVTGAAAFMGKNHGAYLLVASAACMLFAHACARGDAPPFGRRAAAWLAGVAIGLVPLAVVLAAPGALASYWSSILFFLRKGGTNNALPVPWPWRSDLVHGLSDAAVGLGFIAAPVFCLSVLGWAVRRRFVLDPRGRVLLAGAIVGLPYLHHAFSRADAQHLAQSIHPLLIAAFGAMSHRRWAPWLGLGLAVFTAVAAWPRSPLGMQMTAGRGGAPYRSHEVAGDPLMLPVREAALLEGLEPAVAAFVAPREPLLIVSYEAGLYPALGRESPVWLTGIGWWEDNNWWPDGGSSDDRMIREAESRGVDWALVSGTPDGTLPFSSAHRRLSEYLTRHFAPCANLHLTQGIILIRRGGEWPRPQGCGRAVDKPRLVEDGASAVWASAAACASSHSCMRAATSAVSAL